MNPTINWVFRAKIAQRLIRFRYEASLPKPLSWRTSGMSTTYSIDGGEYAPEKVCKSGLHTYIGRRCLECARERSKLWNLENKERAAANARAWAAANPHKVRAKSKRFYDAHPERCAETAKAYRLANFEKTKIKSAEWRSRNPEKCKALRARWAKENPEKIYEINKAQREKNPQLLSEKKAAYREINKEKISDVGRIYRAANQEEIRLLKQNRRALKKAAGGSLSKGLVAKLFKLQKGMCPCCRQPLGDAYHLDHKMPLALGGTNTDDNMQLLRQRCNNQKGAKHPVDFMQSRGFLL